MEYNAHFRPHTSILKRSWYVLTHKFRINLKGKSDAYNDLQHIVGGTGVLPLSGIGDTPPHTKTIATAIKGTFIKTGLQYLFGRGIP